MKKFICCVLFFFLMGSNIFAQDNQLIDPMPAAFPDISPTSEFYNAIYYVKQNGIVNGYSDGTFKSEKTVTRGEFTKIVIGSIYDSTEIENCKNEYIFGDINDSNSFLSHICMAKQNNIISGFSDNTFRPDSEIEFQAAAKILANGFNMEPDLSQISETDKLKPYIIKMGEKKAIPLSIRTREQKITRGELAEMIFRIKTANISKESRIFEDFHPATVQGINNSIITPTPLPIINQSGSYTCNCSKTCTQITSCSEAYYQLNNCGCNERDSDNDGIPCESLCK